MLMPPSGTKTSTGEKRNRRREQKLWSNGQAHTLSLGCIACEYHNICGGLHIKAALFDCLGFCCGKLEHCDTVCPNKPFEFVDRVREIGTFDLGTVPRSAILPVDKLPPFVPLIYHGSRCVEVLAAKTVGLSLYQMIDRQSGTVRYSSRASLEEKFKLLPGAKIVLSGTAKDKPLERWWDLGVRRRIVIRQIRDLGIHLVTTTNYSLFTDVPRFDNLNSIKRIATTHQEFLAEGLPAALHVNARTETDWDRWIDYVGNRDEITHIAYEFGTGAGRTNRIHWHAEHLVKLAQSIDRPLHLVIRGGTSVFGVLNKAYEGISLLDTSAFIKTMKRQVAVVSGNKGVTWTSSPTDHGAPLDELFCTNVRTLEDAVLEMAISERVY